MARHPNIESLLSFFAYEHLPRSLQNVSVVFSDTAYYIVTMLPDDTPELTMMLRKLLEAKDCAVRAHLEYQRTHNGSNDASHQT